MLKNLLGRSVQRAAGLRSLATAKTLAQTAALNRSLKESDPELYGIIEDEKVRQKESLVLIASENFTSKVSRLPLLAARITSLSCRACSMHWAA